MNKALLFLFAVLLALTQAAKSVDDAPLKLIQPVDLPNYSGDFDHFAVDLGGKRLFLAAEDHGTAGNAATRLTIRSRFSTSSVSPA